MGRRTPGCSPSGSSTLDRALLGLKSDTTLHPRTDRGGLDPAAADGTGSRSSLPPPRRGPRRASRPRRRRCRSKASFTVEEVEERGRTTGHDVAAFVDVVSASVGGQALHSCGLTSSDVLDTALALQLAEAGTIVLGVPAATVTPWSRGQRSSPNALRGPDTRHPCRPRPSGCTWRFASGRS